MKVKGCNKFKIPHMQKEKLEKEDWLLKALVWFWLIDETLSANLVYQSDYEIGNTTPSDEANEDHDMMIMMAW